MTDASKLRRSLAEFLGDSMYSTFVQQGCRDGRMRYCQEAAWTRFTSAHPEFAVGLDELATVLRVCHIHGDELQPDTAEVFHGYRDFTHSFGYARARLFPYAAQDAVYTEFQPFNGHRIDL